MRLLKYLLPLFLINQQFDLFSQQFKIGEYKKTTVDTLSKKVEVKGDKFKIKEYKIKKTTKEETKETVKTESKLEKPKTLKFSFVSTLGKIDVEYNKEKDDYIIYNDIPDPTKREACFILSFRDFINEMYSGNLERKIMEIQNIIDESVEGLIIARNIGYGFRELGHMVAVNILAGGLSGKENKKFLQQIGSNFVAGIVNDIATYYKISSNTLEGKIIAEIIKVCSSLYLSRDKISDKKQAIVEDMRASLYAEVAMAKKMLDKAYEHYKNALKTNDYREWREAYYNFRDASVRARSVLAGWVYLEEENFSDQIANAFGEIVGSFIKKNLGEKEKSWLEFFDALQSFSQVFSDPIEERKRDIETIFKSTYVGEAIKLIQREAKDAETIFWKVDRYMQ
ncbi:MAG: hypothetical protein QXM27_02135 [Candidatus Pacearchaeota archaeon]